MMVNGRQTEGDRENKMERKSESLSSAILFIDIMKQEKKKYCKVVPLFASHSPASLSRPLCLAFIYLNSHQTSWHAKRAHELYQSITMDLAAKSFVARTNPTERDDTLPLHRSPLPVCRECTNGDFHEFHRKQKLCQIDHDDGSAYV